MYLPLEIKFFSKLVYDTLIPNKSSIRTYAKNIFYLWENIKKIFLTVTIIKLFA